MPANNNLINSEPITTLDKFRAAFYNFIEQELKIDLPPQMKTVNNLTFSLYINNHVAQYQNDTERGLIELKKHFNIENITDEQKNKLLRFVNAFIELCSV
jgi:hypothetical protein